MTAPRKIPLSIVCLLLAVLALLMAALPKVGAFFGLLEEKHDLVGGIADFSQIILFSLSAVSGASSVWLRYTEQQAPQALAEAAEREATERRRDLLDLLKEVRRQWIGQYLAGSLYHQVMIDLGKELRPEAVRHLWRFEIEQPGCEPRPLPPEQSLTTLFFEFNEKLLILGAPGAGKTISLLVLARDLLDAAEADAERPVPVVFNLSSWAIQRLPLAEWMGKELKEKYGLGLKLSAPWLAQRLLLPLLDGLDEMPEAQRGACIEAIDAYLEENHRGGLVVCCRDADYRALPQALRVNGAVCLQPLDSTQIASYLEQAGPALDGLRAALAQDAELHELARSPLMLNVMSFAYQNLPMDEIGTAAAPNSGRRQAELLDRYIDKMFVRKGERTQPYSKQQTLQWLGWLASRLRQHRQILFLLENLQADWGSRVRLFGVWLVVSAAIGGIIGLIGGGLSHATWFGREVDTLTGPIIGASFATVLGMAYFFFDLDKIEPEEEFTWNWPKSWQEVLRRLANSLSKSLIAISLVVLIGVFSIQSRNIDNNSKLFYDSSAFVLSIFCCIFVTLYDAFVKVKSTSRRMTPNQGIHASLHNMKRFAWIGAIVGFLTVSTHGLVKDYIFGYSELNWPWQEWPIAMFVGFLCVFLLFGGVPALAHYILRLSLYLEGRTPWRYVYFLDYASRLILLQKVGGGYVFIHRLLLEHMAARYEVETQAKAR